MKELAVSEVVSTIALFVVTEVTNTKVLIEKAELRKK